MASPWSLPTSENHKPELSPVYPSIWTVADYRGLLTDREREILCGDAGVSRNYVYQIRSRVRNKIERLAEDIEILETHHPDLLERVEEVVCDRE